MAQGAFKVGDVVVLKSGGPDMVIEIDWGNGTYQCTWFAGEKHQAHTFTGATLNMAE